MKIIPPFKREHFKNAETFQEASKEALSSILSAFDPVNRQKITLSKTFTTINEKRLHTVLVIAPIEAAENMDRLKINGLKIMNRTMFPTADEFWRTDYNGFPKRVMLRMSNVPYLLDDDTLIEKLQLPPDVEPTGTITREKEKLPEGDFFTGKASMLLNIKNETSENELREWSFKSASGERRFEWLDIPFNAHTPALHSCTFCEAENKPHIGHDIAWCRLNKSKKAANQESKQRTKSNEQNSPRRELNHQSTTSQRVPSASRDHQAGNRTPAKSPPKIPSQLTKAKPSALLRPSFGRKRRPDDEGQKETTTTSQL